MRVPAMAGGQLLALVVGHSDGRLRQRQRGDHVLFDRLRERGAVHHAREVADEANTEVVIAVLAVRRPHADQATLVEVGRRREIAVVKRHEARDVGVEAGSV